ncbi:3-ketoacyl-CoA synthase 8-like [Cryptomeria japonica]|uniref:3-ketoacyl-CoA synthase 8-like n=1 Tax=Cryptomeria japonica TaxID=3369 RepID=UPI0027DA0752|nr:3-ketoacyl-CoA synthase 8-like [Cryptomeria japonica]
MLLSNKPQDAGRAKMRLVYSLRTNLAADDEAYDCVFVTEDGGGVYGVRLCPSLCTVAANAVANNLARLGSSVLPLREKLYYAYNWLSIKTFKMKVEPYVPNFKLAFHHFCIHPGGRSVISEIGKGLKLSDYDLEASRMSLFRFGNTSTSGVWYEMAYLEAKRRLKVGERVLQIALGSGFKCNTAVWEVLRDTHPSETSCWDDCIHRYPCNTRLNYADDYCDQWLHCVTPTQSISNDLDTNTT